ncbi:MAG: Ig-like domain-containing protein [Candidatus Faecousia sp.]|nr:Ig-like domain-containing protein [Candidatus Faecousia sp.]
MVRTRIIALFCALCCVFGLCAAVSAAEVDSGSTYCFGTGDFSQEEPITGICITDLPEDLGALMLGSRILREGDVLTADQVAQMTLSPLRTETDQTVELGYLPIYEGRVAEGAVMTISIRGKEDKPPVAEDSALETYKNLPNTGKLKASDPENQSLTFTVTRQPRRGTVTIAGDGTFTYTPKKNKVGVDSFVYTATDPAGKVSREATVTITILKPTDATQYTDTLGNDCRFAAEWMRQTGIFVGETLGDSPCFSPERQVTKGEFVTMLVKALDISVEKEVSFTGYKEDIPLWLQPYLAAAVRSGLTDGLPEQQVFEPNSPITAAEADIMLKNALNREESCIAPEELPLTRAQAACALYDAARQAQLQGIDHIV